MNTAKQPAKFKGAVLIMILAVMTVLIILLAGSIAVVYSAHNRAVVKYSESQGYYTARSILDNFFTELSESTDDKGSDNVDIGKYHMLDLEHNTTKEMPLCIGRALELDLYRAQVQVKDASGNYEKWLVDFCDLNKEALSTQINGFETVAVDYTTGSDGSRTQLYEKFEKYYVNLDITELSKNGGDYNTYKKFYDQFKPVDTVAAGNEPNVIRYDLTQFDGFGSGTLDTDGDGSPDTKSQYGKLSDNGSHKAWITVEVLERIYDMGEGAKYHERFKSGKRSEDHICAKVTAHVIYDNEEVTTTQIWISNPPPIVDASTGLSSLGPIDTTTSITIIGDGAALDNKFHELTNNSTYAGNLYFEGGFDTGTATPSLVMTEQDTFFAGEILKINTNPPKADLFCDGALFYAKLVQLWSSGASFGTYSADGNPNNDHRVNLVTGRFESHSDQKEFYGRIFAEEFDVITKGDWDPNPAGKTVSDPFNINWEDKIHGDVYTDYLGIPIESVYVDFTTDDPDGGPGGRDIAVFRLNRDASGNVIPEGDNRRIEKKLGVDGKLHIHHGITLINGVQSKEIGGRNNFVNTHVTHKVVDHIGDEKKDLATGITYTTPYFTDHRSVLPTAADNDSLSCYLKYSNVDAIPGLQSNWDPSYSFAKTYRVFIDWSEVPIDTFDMDGIQLKYDYKADYKDSDSVSNRPKNLNFNYYSDKSEGNWTLDKETYRKKFELPKINGVQLKLIATDEKEFYLPTHRSLYGMYFYEKITGGVTGGTYPKTFNDDTGAFSMVRTDSNKIMFEKFIQEHSFDTEAVLANIDPAGPVDVDNIPNMSITATPITVAAGGGDIVNDVEMPPWAKVISASGYIPSNSNDGSVYFIDARSNDIDIQLGTGADNNQTFTGTYVVYGDKHVTVTVPGNQSAAFGQTVDLGTSGHCFRFMSAEIYDGIWKDSIVIGKGITTINGGAETDSPNIDWYFSSKTVQTAKLHTGGSGVTTICGYILAPTASFDLDTNINGIQRDTYYYGKTIPSDSGNDKYTIFGSIFCNGYKGGQHAGVCFIPRGDGYVDDGSKPMLNKDGMYRARR